MAWFQAMGADSVEYHEHNTVDRADDFAGRALDYYGSRGETPLFWGGNVARRLGLEGVVTRDAYRAAFGPGGFRDPLTGERLANTTIPGYQIIVSAHKTIALLGLLGRADDMHAILDAETGGTMDYLEALMRERGGRRGQAAVVTPTTGLAYVVTRHATTREGDPGPHDHIMIASITEMLDTKGGFKGLFSALVRDFSEAAAMAGRMRSAAKAIELGYAIAWDHGDSGRARDWRIVGIPQGPCDLFSKRSDQITEYLEDKGHTSYRARNIAARATRARKDDTGVDQLLPGWIAELETAGWTVDDLNASLETGRARCTGLAAPLTDDEIDALAAKLLHPEGDFSTRWKHFGRTRLVAEIAPLLYGHPENELNRVADRVIASEYVQPLIGLPGAREQQYAVTAVLANEYTIAEIIERLIAKPGPHVPKHLLRRAVSDKAREIGGSFSDGQIRAIADMCGPQTAVRVIVGIAGAGKTTALDAASNALQAAGYQILGTATSGQAAQNLGREARIQARTMRSLLSRLDSGSSTLDDHTIVVLDEAGMTADADLARLLLAVERTGAKIVLVGDHRQLAAVGPGGALEAVLDRHPNVVTTLTENMRQRDRAERAALTELRSGSVDAALDFYSANNRIRVAPRLLDTMYETVNAYVADRVAGHDTFMLAWRRDSVAILNRFARVRARELGWVTGDDFDTPDGTTYAVGDPVVTLQPNYEAELVTSQRGEIIHIDHEAQALAILTDHGRRVVLSREAIDKNHLAHGYALTVHREQGATGDRTHFLAEGGGRQLAYVAMSRARDTSTAWTTADDLDTALDLIRYDWSQDQNQHWISDQADIGHDPYTQPAPPDLQARRLALRAELADLQRQAPPDVSTELATARRHLHKLEQDLHNLVHGIGRWQHTPQGQTARTLQEISARRQQLSDEIEATRNPLERHKLNRHARALDNAAAHHRDDWDRICRPAERHLQATIWTASHRVERLEQTATDNAAWLAQHPELARRLDDIRRQLRDLGDDPNPPEPQAETPGTGTHPPDGEQARIRQRLNQLQQRATERSTGPSLGL